MEKTFFSPRLFREGVRQLKIPGIILAVFYTLMAIVIPTETITDALSRTYEYGSSSWPASAAVDPEITGFYDMFPVLDLTFFLAVPFMVFWLFHFLTSRRNSDFYHALPVSSVCLTVSLFASVMAWAAGVLLLQTVVGTVIHAAYPTVFTVSYGSVLRGVLGKLAVGLMSGGYALLGMALTGTVMSNLVTAVLLPYLPLCGLVIVGDRLYDAYSSSIFKTEGGLKSNTALLSFINNFEDFLQLNLMNLFDEPTYTAAQIVYTFLGGLAVLALAVFVLKRRKSEIAGKPAVNRAVHTAIRIAGTLFILWFLGGTFISGGLSLFVVVLALVAYFAYELITTRRWYNLLRSLVWLPLVAVLYFLPFFVSGVIVSLC